MLNSLKSMFGFSRSTSFRSLVKNGAVIIDVRTKNEFATGHIGGSINIPLNELKEGVSRLEKGTAIITCCASGLRSASATNVLLAMGYRMVYNGGGYMQLAKKI